MQKHNLQDLIEFDEPKFPHKVLTGEPGFRPVLSNFRAEQGMAEYSTSAEIRMT